MPFSDHARNRLGDAIARGQTLVLPSTLWFALHTSANPSPANEFAVANGYTRIGVPVSLTAFKGTHGTTSGPSTGTGGQFRNAAAISFGTPNPAAWPDAYGVSWWDAASGGNMWQFGALSQMKACPAGVPVLFDPDALILLIS